MFGKPVDLSTLPLPPGVNHQPHPASNTPVPPKGSATEEDGPAKAGFGYVKRDLVRLLGISCAGEKAVQDRVRACGGIPVVMNLCVVDERNPCKFPERRACLDLPSSWWRSHCCASHLFIWSHGSSQALTLCIRFPDLREHAIFALRNLLEGNTENQHVVDQIRPLPRPPS